MKLILIRLSQRKQEKENYSICDEEHCHCEKGIFIPALKHTLNITIFIMIITFIINIIFSFVGEDILSKILLKNSIFSPFITSLIGLIPNCASSVMLTELYINNAINVSSLISGLLTGSGAALLILFKSNKNIKENIKILFILYILGVLSGIILELFGITLKK